MAFSERKAAAEAAAWLRLLAGLYLDLLGARLQLRQFRCLHGQHALAEIGGDIVGVDALRQLDDAYWNAP